MIRYPGSWSILSITMEVYMLLRKHGNKSARYALLLRERG